MRNSVHTWKTAVVKGLVAAMIMLSVIVVPSVTTKAATAPTITKSSKNLMIGSTYDLNVKGKVENSTYAWTTSNKKVATVDKKGIVKGLNKGTATITCTVTTPNNTYKLTSKVTVIYPAVVFRIKNKVTALNLGQTYDLDRYIPSISNDKTTWTSSDLTVAAPDKYGKFIALKEGTVTITGKTLSGKTDSVTIKVLDKEGVVTTQEDLNAALTSGIGLITIRTDAAVVLTIAPSKYTKTKLVVEAPKADIHNSGVFASIDIKKIASNSWYEDAVGNLLNILATDSRIVIGTNAVVKIEVSESGAKLKIENNGVVKEVAINKSADVNISGTSTTDIPVLINVPNITLTTSVPLNMNCTEKVSLVLLKGAEATKIQAASDAVAPTIKSEFTVKLTVGTGDNAKEQTVVGVAPTPTPAPITGGNGTPSAPSNTVTKTVNSDNSISYSLSAPYTQLKAINVTYKDVTYSIDGTTLDALESFLANDATTIALWKITTNTTNTYNGQQVTVKGNSGDLNKIVSFTGGKLDGKSYEVTVGNNNSVTVTNKATNNTFTVTKVNNDTLKISANHSVLTFAPTF